MNTFEQLNDIIALYDFPSLLNKKRIIILYKIKLIEISLLCTYFKLEAILFQILTFSLKQINYIK